MILGLDLATKRTGYGILKPDGSLVTSGQIIVTGYSPYVRMKDIYEQIKEIVKKFGVSHIILEDVPVNTHSNIKTGKELSVLQGVILSLCFQYNIPYVLYNPSAWRSIIGTYDGTRAGMKRNVQKQKAVELVNNIYGVSFVYNEKVTKKTWYDDDRAEAILIALAYIKECEDSGI